MNCTKCEVSFTERPLYRNAPKGIVCEDWRCIDCLDDEFKPNKETVKIANVIVDSNKTKEGLDGK